MNIILLSGGSGKRLWPLSNDVRSKQFIKIFRSEDGKYESMVQRVYRQIRLVDSGANVTIATSRTQVSAIFNQLGSEVDICIEPCRKDTFPAIILACAFLNDVKGIDENEPIIVCPVDPYVNQQYFVALQRLNLLIKNDEAKLALMGIEPTYPSEKYGYIIPIEKSDVSGVALFKEKPNEQKAKEYIKQGALWNGGVFAFKLKYLLNKAHELVDFIDYYDLLAKYNSLEKISFDYAVVEQETDIQVVRFAGLWKDIGTWNTLTEVMDEQTIGNVFCNEKCNNVHVINELSVPILCMGVKDVVVSASAEGILVSDKEQSALIKPVVDKFEQQIMFAEKSWGKFEVIDVGNESMTIKITLKSGQGMSYHYHDYRSEVWTVVRGTGYVVLDGVKQRVMVGDVVRMPVGCKHTIIAETEMVIMEVQIGKEITVHDKIKCGGL